MYCESVWSCVFAMRERFLESHHTATYISSPALFTRHLCLWLCNFSSSLLFLSLSLFGQIIVGLFPIRLVLSISFAPQKTDWLTISNGWFMCSLNSTRSSFMRLNYVFDVVVCVCVAKQSSSYDIRYCKR